MILRPIITPHFLNSITNIIQKKHQQNILFIFYLYFLKKYYKKFQSQSAHLFLFVF